MVTGITIYKIFIVCPQVLLNLLDNIKNKQKNPEEFVTKKSLRLVTNF